MRVGLSDVDMSGFNADEARYDRMNRTNPPDFAPGMGNDLDSAFASSTSQSVGGSMDDLFGNNGSGGGDPFGGGMNNDPFGNSGGFGGGSLGGSGFGGDPFGGSNFGGLGTGGIGGMNDMGMGGNQQQPKSTEDKFWDVASTAGKGTVSFFKEFVSSFKYCNPFFWQRYGYNTLICSGIVASVGLVFWLLGVSFGFSLLLGGVVAAIPSVLLLMFNTEKAQNYSSPYNDEAIQMPQPTPMPEPQPAFDTGFGATVGMDSFGEDMEDEDDDDGYDGFGDDEDDNWGDDTWDDEPEEQPDEGMSSEDALATAQSFDKGMYTRDYLYDMFTKTLPTLKPDFNRMTNYDDSEDVFEYWADKLREAAEVSGCKEDLPELDSLSENLFTMVFTCDRPAGFKPDKVAEELASIYAMENSNGEKLASRAETFGAKCKITVFTGKSAMISLKDMYKIPECEKFMKDHDNYIPVVLGVDTKGGVLYYDFKKLESVIITGMPRSGKSWFVQNVLYQMCSFVSPSELNLFICDPKEGISDFKAFVLPHVKKFVSDDNKIVNTLRDLVKIEGPRRKKIIGDAGFVNIWDFKEKYPEVKLPIIYVVVDEIVTLASRMDKETNNEFRMLLRELISQLPALGIRAFLIPHVLNNDIIEKKTSDLVPCKISVCGDADHIEKATGSKYKDFPYKLKNKGDMAVRMPAVSSDTMFIHGAALTNSNPKNNELFDYARRVWGMLEPDEGTSITEAAELSTENQELLNKMESEEDDGLDLFS